MDFDTVPGSLNESLDAMGILEYYYDNFSVLRLVGFFGSLILTFMLTWLIPTLLQKVFREGWGIEINFESEAYKQMIINKYLAKIGSNKCCDPIYVNDEYKTKNGLTMFLRSNLFTLFYLVLRLGILGIGLFLTFLIVSQDLISLIASFSIAGIVTFLQVGIYLQHLLAHACIIITGKHNNGECITFPSSGLTGVIVHMGMIYTTLINVNPDWTELDSKSNDTNSNSRNNNTGCINPSQFVLNNSNSSANRVDSTNFILNPNSSSNPHYLSTASAIPIVTNNPQDIIVNMSPNYKDVVVDGPFGGKYFTRHKKLSNHVGYRSEFIYIHIPNYDLLFSHVIIDKE